MMMVDLIQYYITPRLRQKIYLVMVFVSLILFFYSSWQIKWVIVDTSAPLGLASYYTPCYWVGLVILVVTSFFAFIDRDLKKDTIFIIILIVLGLFLLGIRVFVEANAQNPDSYYPTSEVYNLLAARHLDISNPPLIGSYYTWPAIHFISASLLELTGADLIPIIKYTPLFWILCFVFITYGIGKRLNLTSDLCFLLAFLAITSWRIGYAGFYYARFPAMVLFLLIFMFLIIPRRNVTERITVILMFAVLILSHGLTAVAVISAVMVLSFYRRDYGIAILVVVIFSAWYIYQVTTVFELGIHAFAKPMLDIFSLIQVERYAAAASVPRLVLRYSELCSAALYAALMVGSAVLLWRRRITGERRRQVFYIICWAIGAILIVFWGHEQAVSRIFVFCLVPAACIIVLSFSSRKLLIPLMCVIISLSPLVNYASIGGWGQVTTSELKGAEFFAHEVKPDSYFYGYVAGLILYYNPSLVTAGGYGIDYAFPSSRKPENADLSIMDRLHYIIISKLGSAILLMAWQADPVYGTWPGTMAGQRSDLLYNNGYFRIYENHLVK